MRAGRRGAPRGRRTPRHRCGGACRRPTSIWRTPCRDDRTRGSRCRTGSSRACCGRAGASGRRAPRHRPFLPPRQRRRTRPRQWAASPPPWRGGRSARGGRRLPRAEASAAAAAAPRQAGGECTPPCRRPSWQAPCGATAGCRRRAPPFRACGRRRQTQRASSRSRAALPPWEAGSRSRSCSLAARPPPPHSASPAPRRAGRAPAARRARSASARGPSIESASARAPATSLAPRRSGRAAARHPSRA
mmetsp:Transcript_819/g.2431  ORF Transcript_819/g.2431 Transcript_819/m.2431 type:complete len:247 (+) Transcript_819:305-1045(+)